MEQTIDNSFSVLYFKEELKSLSRANKTGVAIIKEIVLINLRHFKAESKISMTF
tara:strand:- start:143 stop:304 length:162 start_codon:yes stop_codon:yes gene_type:complete